VDLLQVRVQVTIQSAKTRSPIRNATSCSTLHHPSVYLPTYHHNHHSSLPNIQPLPFISFPTKLNQTERGKTITMEEEWSADANEAVELSLISTTSGKPIATFHPQFTYGIFGDSENIFGYKDPNLQISFAANDMKCCLDISYEDMMEPQGSVQAEDLETIIGEFLPSGMALFQLLWRGEGRGVKGGEKEERTNISPQIARRTSKNSRRKSLNVTIQNGAHLGIRSQNTPLRGRLTRSGALRLTMHTVEIFSRISKSSSLFTSKGEQRSTLKTKNGPTNAGKYSSCKLPLFPRLPIVHTNSPHQIREICN